MNPCTLEWPHTQQPALHTVAFAATCAVHRREVSRPVCSSIVSPSDRSAPLRPVQAKAEVRHRLVRAAAVPVLVNGARASFGSCCRSLSPFQVMITYNYEIQLRA